MARLRCEGLGVDPAIFDGENVSPEDNSGVENSGYELPSSPESLLLSGKYNNDGYWPPLRPDISRGSGLNRPATGYDERIPGVIDRLFSSPIAHGTTEKELKKVRDGMTRKTIVPRRGFSTGSRPVTADAYIAPSGTTTTLNRTRGLDSMADTIFNEDENARAISPTHTKHIQKLSYAEKLQVMIMQVKDTLTEEEMEKEKDNV